MVEIQLTFLMIQLTFFPNENQSLSFYSNNCSKTNYDQSQMTPTSKNTTVFQCNKTLNFLNS